MDVKLNDQYWLDLGHSMVDGSISRIETEIDSLKAYVGGIQIPYTLAAIAETLFLDFKDNWWIHLILLSIPIGIIKLSTYYLNVSKITDPVSFNPRNPNQIKRVYSQTFFETYNKMVKAKHIALIATLAMFVSLVGNAAYTGITKKNEQEKLQPSFQTELSADKSSILLTGQFPKDSKLFMYSTFITQKDSTYKDTSEFLIGSEGLFFEEFAIDTGLVKVELITKYQDNNKKFKNAFIETIEISK